ncbi:MAG: DUF479 domain-containing protein [Chitinophagaceae bacterium]|nr:DUF479 domain-containing protein [Chitinophagaceae bacterium]
MNFLAHAYLSFDEPQVLVGNMISDFVKGKKRYEYIKGIQNGIELHRRIDCFTDAHLATIAAKKIFKPEYRLYSGAIVDIVFDHFLANDAGIFSEASLLQFSDEVYKILEDHSSHLPVRFVSVLSNMKTQNWLFNYRHIHGVERSIRGLVRRSTYLSDYETAFNIFNEHYHQLEICYQQFFQDVKYFSQQQITLIS